MCFLYMQTQVYFNPTTLAMRTHSSDFKSTFSMLYFLGEIPHSNLSLLLGGVFGFTLICGLAGGIFLTENEARQMQAVLEKNYNYFYFFGAAADAHNQQVSIPRCSLVS